MGVRLDKEALVRDVARLRKAERVKRARPDVAPVRRDLEGAIGPTLSRARTARVLGVSQTALDRWINAGRLSTVMTPTGRVEVPLPVVLELFEAIEALKQTGRDRHLLAAALDRSQPPPSSPSQPPRGHATAEQRSLAYHRLVADRLDDQLISEARHRIDGWLAQGRIPVYARRWRRVLDRPLEEIAGLMTADSQEARDLRQNSPFAGVLGERERREVIEAIG